MGISRSCCFIWFLLCLNFYVAPGFNESLDAILHEHAIRAMFHGRPHTGELYYPSIPASLAGMKVSVVRVRSRTLWRIGANFSNFYIPSQSWPVPSARRLLIVYHDLGNWSSYYYNLPGYTLQTSVVGFLIYDASKLNGKNLIKLSINTTGRPIVVQFYNSIAPTGANQESKCATFGEDGRVLLSDVIMENECHTTTSEHYSIMIPTKKQRKIITDFWVVGIVLGIFGLILFGLLMKLLFRVLMVKRTNEMEREADEEEVLQTICIESSKLPRATFTRTQPILEDSGHP